MEKVEVKEAIIRELDNLPPEKMWEVLDFIRFLIVRFEGRPALVYDEQTLAQLYAECEEEDRVLAEAGMALAERNPAPNGRPARARLSGDRVVVWVGDDVSEPFTVAIFPRSGNPLAMAWRSAALLAVCERFGIE